MNWYSFVYGFGMGVIAVLAYFLKRDSPDTESKRYLVLLSVASLIWIGAEFLYYTLWGTVTVSIYYAKLVSVVFLPYFTLMTVLCIPIRSNVLKFKYTPLIFFIPVLISLFFIFASPFNHLFASGVRDVRSVDEHLRYIVQPGVLVFVWFLPYAYSYLLLSLGILMYNLRHLKTKIDERLLVVLFAAISIPLAMNFYHLLMPNIYPDPTSLAVIFSATLMLYSVSRFKILGIPVSERWKIEMNHMSGKSYLVSCGIYEGLRDILQEKEILLVTTRDPKWIGGFANNRAIWVSELDEKTTIRPERLEFEIEYSIVEFWRQNPNGIVILDCLAYLRTSNPMEKIRVFIKDLMDTAFSKGGTILVVKDELYLFPQDEYHLLDELFDGELDMDNECRKYVFKKLENINGIHDDIFFLTTINPQKIGIRKNYYQIRSGDNLNEMMSTVILRIEQELKRGKDLCIVGIDNLFIGWNYLQIYWWLKLVADLARKYGKNIYIVGKIQDKNIARIVNVYS